MKSFVRFVASLALCNQVLIAQDEPAQRIFVNLTWQVWTREIRPDGSPRDRSATVNTPSTGTCWVTEHNGEKIIVTAAHNLGLTVKARPSEVGGKKVREIASLTAKPVLGTLAYEVAKVGLLKGRYDVAFILPADTNAFNGSRVIPLARVPAKREDKVKIYGFPNTSSPHPTDTTVVDFTLGQDYMKFATPLEPGYSGGVVLNADGKALGVVIATEAKQSTAIVVNAAVLSRVQWRTAREVLTQDFSKP